MKLKFYITILVITLFSLHHSHAQTELLTGRLIDVNTNKPIANAIISEENGESITFSNFLGYFQVEGANNVIVVKHVAYKTVKAELNTESPNFLVEIPQERYLLKALHIKELPAGYGFQKTLPLAEEDTEKVDENKLEKELLASFPGGLKAFHDYLTYRVHLNKDSLPASFDMKVLFTINKSGDLKLDSVLGESQSSGIIRSILEKSPKWSPALQNGLPTPLAFEQTLTYNIEAENIVQAEPEGGIQTFYDYVAKNLSDKYPRLAQRMGIEGIVFVQCDIEIDGSVKNVIAVKGIGGGCDEVAVDVVKNSPNWNPALEDGKAVRSQRVIPIRFTLN